MPPTSSGLARITVTVAGRRLDLAVPDDVLLAELLPELVRQADPAGDLGTAHGGWVLRRLDGEVLSNAKTLRSQGVRDGHAVVVARADETWPEPEYDDIVEAIAANGRLGLPWSPAASRRTAIGAGSFALLAGAAVLATTSERPTIGAGLALGLTAVLLGGGAVAARSLRDAGIAVALGAVSMAYAFATGVLVGGSIAAELIAGSIALTIAGCTALAVVGTVSPLFVTGITAGLAGVIGGVAARAGSAPVGGAVVLGCVAFGAGLVPAVSLRLGGLARGDVDRLVAAVSRTDQWIVGLHLGGALAVGVAGAVAVADGNAWSRLLVAVCAGALGLRARAYAAVRQRLAVLVAAIACALPLVVGAAWAGPDRPALAGVLAIVGVLIMLWTAATDRAPYLSRVGDALEIVCVAAVLPLLCGALGLYTKLRGLS